MKTRAKRSFRLGRARKILACVALFSCAISTPAFADCNTGLMAGDHALYVRWQNAVTTGTVSAKAEIRANGRIVLRGARVTYFENATGGEPVRHEGYGAGTIALAPQCTGLLSIGITERSSGSDVVKIDANVIVSGNRQDPSVKGGALMDILYPSLLPKYDNVFAEVELAKMSL